MKPRRSIQLPAERAPSAWPSWVCSAIDAASGEVCEAPARWQQIPVAGATIPWLYCDHHRPTDAEPIPEDAPFVVTRLELRVAVAGAPGNPAGAAEESIRRIACAVESAGALIVGVRVRQSEIGAAEPSGERVGRLGMAGRPEPLPAGTVAVEPQEWLPAWRRRKGTAL